MRIRTSRRHTITRFAAALIAAVGLLAWPAAARAQRLPTHASTGSGSSAAVVTPVLRTLDFGDTVGMPLACNLTSSVVSITANGVGASNATPSIDAAILAQCADLSTRGDSYLQQAIGASRQLTFINPVADPLIANTAAGLQTFGKDYGSSVAPVGPALGGLSGTIAYFEGS